MNRTTSSFPAVFSAIFLAMATGCVLFDAAMAGETGPASIAPAGGETMNRRDSLKARLTGTVAVTAQY